MVAMSLTIFNGCQKDDELLNYKDENNLSDTEYAYNKLSLIGFNVLKDSKDSKFKNHVYNKVNEKFDNDFDVLLKDLEISNQNSSLKSAINSNVLEAFKGIDDNNYYPQVFIPFFDELKENNILETSDPVLVIFAGGEDDKKDEFEGYILNGNNEPEKLDFLITEDFARKNEVWVISINERVDNHGEVLPTYNSIGKKNTLKSITNSINCQIENMTVTRHYESWASGKSEVSIRAYLEYGDGLNSDGIPVDVISDRTTDDLTGILIRQFTRDDVDYARTFNLNFNLQEDWSNGDFESDPIIYLYVIFESDSWPTGTRTESDTLANGATRYMSFRSADPSYSIGTIYSNTNNGEFQSKYAGTYTVNNSNIQFNTELY